MKIPQVKKKNKIYKQNRESDFHANKGIILKIYEIVPRYEYDVIIQFEKIEIPLKLFDSASVVFPLDTEVKFIATCGYPKSMDDKTREKFYKIKIDTETDFNYIKSAGGVVVKKTEATTKDYYFLIVDIGGFFVETASIKRKVGIGDYVRVGRIDRGGTACPLVIPHKSFSQHISLNRMPYANNGIILEVKKRKTKNEWDILVNCEKTEKPFSISVSTAKKIKKLQKVKFAVATNSLQVLKRIFNEKTQRVEYLEKQETVEMINAAMEPNVKPGYYTKKECDEGWYYIWSAVGKVIKIAENEVKENRDSSNFVIIDAGGLLIEATDRNPVKTKIGDLVRVGVSHYCSALFDAETGERLDG